MVAAVINSAQSGLAVAQAGLLVTSQNITGAGVEGYSRRTASAVLNRLADNSATLSGTGFSVEGFARSYSKLLDSQRLIQQGKTSYSDALVQSTELLDSVIADESNSLALAITQFFDAAGNLVSDPQGMALRANFTEKADAVMQRMQGMADIMSQAERDARAALSSTLERINSFTTRLGLVNSKILEGTSKGNFAPSADYLDERDRVLLELQKLVGGQTMINSDGTATHYLEGIPLVEGVFVNKVLTAGGFGTPVSITVQFSTYRTGHTNELSAEKVRQGFANSADRRFRGAITSGLNDGLITSGEAAAYLQLVNSFVPEMNRRLDSVAIALLGVSNALSPTPIFGFRTDSGLVSNLNEDALLSTLRALPLNNAGDLFALRERLTPDSATYDIKLVELRAGNFVSIAPKNPNDWRIEQPDVMAFESRRLAFTTPLSEMVSYVGNTIATWTNEQQANQSVMNILNDRREAISGVNLDEEAANMVKFQQLYTASSKVLQTSNQLFDTLIAMLTR